MPRPRRHSELAVPPTPLPRLRKRASTGNVALGLTQQSSVASVKRACWTTIRERMASRGSILSAVDENLHHRIMDGVTDDPEVKGLFVKLLANPMTILDEDLLRMFSLRELSESSVPAAGIEKSFYVRSCTITVGQLRQVVQAWKDDHLFFEVGDLWVDYLKAASATDTTRVCIRYVGMTGGRSTGHKRFLADLRNRKYGVWSAFCNALAVQFPELLVPPGCWKVYEFSDASIGSTLPGGQSLLHT